MSEQDDVKPPTQTTTFTVVSNREVQEVVFQPEGWVQVLHRFVREDMPRLTLAPTRIQLHMFDRRDRRSGRSITDRKAIAAACSLSAAAISEGLRTLESFQPHSLLAVHSPTEFEVYPGIPFAGSAPAPALRHGEPEPDLVRRREDHLRHGEPEFATANDHGDLHRERARGAQNQNYAQNDDSEDALAAVVKILLEAGAGFAEPDARRLAMRADGDERRVRSAIAKAHAYRRQGTLRIGPGKDALACMRGVIATAIREGWALFDQAGADKYAAERKAAQRVRDVDALRERMRRLDAGREFCGLDIAVKAAFGGWDGLHDSGVLSPQWRNWGDRTLLHRIREAAAAAART